MKKKTLMTLLISGLVMLGNAWADQQPRSLSTDKRVRVVAYDPNNVVTVKASQLVETSIQFAQDEAVLGVESGDSAAWTVKVNKNRPNILFIKPTVDYSDTSFTVMTDKKLYHFHFVTDPKETPSSKDVTYNVRFVYPEDDQKQWQLQMAQKQHYKNATVNETSVNPMQWNTDYSFSDGCSKELVPLQALDDGKFTYFRFAENVEIPAIFIVDKEDNESLANWSMVGKFVKVSRLARQFTLRNGNTVSCIFNDSYRV